MNRKEYRELVEGWRVSLSESFEVASVESILRIVNNLEEISRNGSKVKIVYDLDGDYGRVEYDVKDDVVSGAIDFERELSERSSGNFFIFETFPVTKGFGPLLYEILIEKASEEGVCLMSDRGKVSDDAKSVWDKYMMRPDIEYHQLSGDIDSSLSKCYYKVGELIVLKKLRESSFIDFIEV
jgi:hypothetical protein